MCQINRTKSFDRFDWDFIFSASKTFGCGGKFIHIIKVALMKIQSKIKTHRLLSYPFNFM